MTRVTAFVFIYCIRLLIVSIRSPWHLPTIVTGQPHVVGLLPHLHHHAAVAVHAEPVAVCSGRIRTGILVQDLSWLSDGGIKREFSGDMNRFMRYRQHLFGNIQMSHILEKMVV